MEKRQYVSVNGDARNMFQPCDFHYLQHIGTHPSRGTSLPKIVDMEVKLEANSPCVTVTQINHDPKPVNTDLQDVNSSSDLKPQVSASGKHSKRKLQVNDVVEVYFYHKDEIPSEDEPPVKNRRAKPNPEAILKQQRENEEDRL